MAQMLLDLATQPSARRVGAKASRLGWLMSQGWSVPPAVVAPFEVTDRLRESPLSELPRLRKALQQRIRTGQRYIVRSSANVEDLGARSFAGQFPTIEDVGGDDDVLAAMAEVATSWRSLQVREYARRAGIDPQGVRVAVIVQEMVMPVAAGVAFSRDPVSGADRVVVETVGGRGQALLGRGVDPQRWVANEAGMLVRPEAPFLAESVLDQVLSAVRGVAEASGQPADVEWVWDGVALHLVQWRPITGLRPPRIWSSRLARDMLPGLIPPLVWSVNVPVLSGVWVQLVTEAVGDVGLDADDLVRAFGYRAYFNSSALGAVFESLGMPADSLERMRAGTGQSAIRPPMSMLIRRTPRLARFAWRLGTWQRQGGSERADLEREWRSAEEADVSALSDRALLERAVRLRALLARAGRLNVVTPLLADHWAAAVRRTASELGLQADRVDPGQDLAEVRALDPSHALAGIDPADDDAWQEFLERFGHLSDSPNDCSRPTWSEQPDEIIAVLRQGGGRAKRREPGALTRADLLAAAPLHRRRRVARRWDRASRYRQMREEVGHSYARIYSLLRPTFLEAGRRMCERGVLISADDVFLLDLEEVRLALLGALPDAADRVRVHREEMSEAEPLVFPETIVGDDPVPIRGRATAEVLLGVPTSRGRHTGPARVVTSMVDAGPIGPRDVLVLSAADVTWTPLLMRAGAVVTETGGMLAHASIVAREFGIPCVASVVGAAAIPEGATTCVDGGTGEVMVLQTDDGNPPDPDEEFSS